MATYLPPTEELPIFDNQVFDIANNTYLTYTDAKKYFVSFPIAQGTSTISDLITGSISYLSPVSGSFFNIGTNQVSGGTIRIGPSGGTAGVSVHCANIDFKNNAMNNATSNTGGDVAIGSLQTSGTLNIGTGTSRTVDGIINIGTGSSSVCPINIGSSSTPITFNNSPILASGKYITTTSSPLAITAPISTQVGYRITGETIAATFPASDNVTSVGRITLTAGTWILHASRGYNNSNNSSRILFSFGTTVRVNEAVSSSDYEFGLTTCVSSSTINYMTLSGSISITAPGNTIVYLNFNPTYSIAPTVPTTNAKFTAIRIA